jgi:hypothetical protein
MGCSASVPEEQRPSCPATTHLKASDLQIVKDVLLQEQRRESALDPPHTRRLSSETQDTAGTSSTYSQVMCSSYRKDKEGDAAIAYLYAGGHQGGEGEGEGDGGD